MAPGAVLPEPAVRLMSGPSRESEEGEGAREGRMWGWGGLSGGGSSDWVCRGHSRPRHCCRDSWEQARPVSAWKEEQRFHLTHMETEAETD